MLNLISSNCTKCCTASCRCQNHGLKCSIIFGYCRGNFCLNVVEATSEDAIESIPDENYNFSKIDIADKKTWKSGIYFWKLYIVNTSIRFIFL